MPKASNNATSDSRGQHGGLQVPGLSIDSYNLPIADPEGEGFLGDRASQRAFRALLDKVRREHRTGDDPFGGDIGRHVRKKEMDLVMASGNPDAAHLVHLAAEEHAQQLAYVVRGFLLQPEWKRVEAVIFGGGFPDSQVGCLSIRRAMRLLEVQQAKVDLSILQPHPDEGGLLGWVHLAPAAVLDAYDAFLAVDVGGSNIRCGIVEHKLGDAKDGSQASVIERLHWRHASDQPDRAEAIDRLAAMLNGLTAEARSLHIRLAPFIGIACPGEIQPDGGITTGAQNLPGDWRISFNLPKELRQRLDQIDEKLPAVVMHNDAVVQGLSERPRMQKYERWAVLTIGTGLGNASYTNR